MIELQRVKNIQNSIELIFLVERRVSISAIISGGMNVDTQAMLVLHLPELKISYERCYESM